MIECDNAIESARLALKDALDTFAEVDLSWIQPPPSNDGWTLAPDALRLLTAVVSRLRPQHILEFGSGLSTRVLARACDALEFQCAISSIDQDPEFSSVVAREYAERPAANSRVSFQVAPLVAREYGGKWLPAYLMQPQRFASQQPVDLVLIDGPSAVLGGREGAFYQAMDVARRGTLVLLDDAARREERAAISHWQDNLGEAIEVIQLPGFIRGMVAIIIREPIRRSELLSRRVCLTRREIEAMTRPEETFIVAGDEWWRDEIAVGRNSLPFLEREGHYWGPPPNDETAIRELERLRQSGARFLMFGWPTFWWLEHYGAFHRHLRARFGCVVENDRLVVFDLTCSTASQAANEDVVG